MQANRKVSNLRQICTYIDLTALLAMTAAL